MFLKTGAREAARRKPALKAVQGFTAATVLLAATAVAAGDTGSEHADGPHRFSCGVPAQLAWSNAPANIFSLALSQATPVRIVVLGSSSTKGTGVSKRGKSFPRHLEADLKKTFGADRISVSNAGRGGETAAKMLRRLNRDVLAKKPHLVIWQTGVNDALRRVDPGKFEMQLRTGIQRLRTAKIDVVLVDQQDFPRVSRSKAYAQYQMIMERVAQSEQVPLLHRYRIMRYLAASRDGGLRTLLAPDQFHMNDFGHKCIGEILADGLVSLRHQNSQGGKGESLAEPEARRE